MSPRLKGVVLILLAFAAGLFLAALQHLVPRWVASPPGHVVTVAVDWLAPPLAGALLAAALLCAVALPPRSPDSSPVGAVEIPAMAPLDS